jgi:heme-degrading monooxygenase HmoA
MAVTLITAFEVPPEADEPFIAGWERARDFLATRDGFSTTALYRALREDTVLRFVNVAHVDSPDAWQQAIADPEFPGRMPFTSHPSLYEAVREDGEPEGEGGVVLINPWEVPVGEDERFLTDWMRARDALAACPGYLGNRLHRSLAPTDFRFVNVGRWSSPLMFTRALQQPEVQGAATAVPFRSHPALYEVVRG